MTEHTSACLSAPPDRTMSVVNDWADVPAFANECEEHAWWSTHSLGDRLLEQFTRGDDDRDL